MTDHLADALQVLGLTVDDLDPDVVTILRDASRQRRTEQGAEALEAAFALSQRDIYTLTRQEADRG
jgi:hypothetical protein